MDTGQATLQGAGVVLHKDGTRTPFVISGDVPPGQEEAAQALVNRFNAQFQSQGAGERPMGDDPDDDEPPVGDPPDEEEDEPPELDPQGV